MSTAYHVPNKFNYQMNKFWHPLSLTSWSACSPPGKSQIIEYPRYLHNYHHPVSQKWMGSMYSVNVGERGRTASISHIKCVLEVTETRIFAQLLSPRAPEVNGTCIFRECWRKRMNSQCKSSLLTVSNGWSPPRKGSCCPVFYLNLPPHVPTMCANFGQDGVWTVGVHSKQTNKQTNRHTDTTRF